MIKPLPLRLNRYIAHRPTPRQAAFLLVPHMEAFFGGAVGGGKSEALLMAALQYADHPEYHAVIVRESFAALEESGALLERARRWLLGTDAIWKAADRQWRFPSGATVSFRPLGEDADQRAFMGAEYQFIGIDEVTTLREDQYRWLLSRLRRPKGSPLPLRMRCTGMPFGPGIVWVRRWFVEEGRSQGRIYIPSRMEDNPFLDQEAYRRTLSNLEPVVRAQLLQGDWTVRPEGGLFQRAWFDRQVVDEQDLPETLELCRYWDMAATEPARGTDPDYTAGVLLGQSEEGYWWILDVARTRASPLAVQHLVRRTAERDVKWAERHRYERPAIRMEQEPGSSGAMVIDHYAREVLSGYDFAGDRPTGKKRTRAAPVVARAEAGHLFMLRGTWNGELLDEISAFPLGDHDDQVDALSGAFSLIAEEEEVTYIVLHEEDDPISPF